MEKELSISCRAVRAALQEAYAGLSQPTTDPISADDFARLISKDEGDKRMALVSDILGIVAAVQEIRDSSVWFDHALRRHGLVTRAREVRA